MGITLENAIAFVGLLGLGGILGTYLRILWERKNSAFLDKQKFKETRFKCIINLMYTCLDFEKRAPLLREHGRNFATIDTLLDELKTEWINMLLFASDDVLKKTHAFLKSPNRSEFKTAVLAMREDLWGGKLSADINGLEFD